MFSALLKLTDCSLPGYTVVTKVKKFLQTANADLARSLATVQWNLEAQVWWDSWSKWLHQSNPWVLNQVSDLKKVVTWFECLSCVMILDKSTKFCDFWFYA